jgi:hypothetical protein
MKKLIALLAAIGAVVFFWRKKHADDDAWDTASDTASSWGETASDKAGDVADAASDKVADAGDAASDATDAAADAVDDATS